MLVADAFVVACGSYSAPLLHPVGVDLLIYPDKGFRATSRLFKPQPPPSVSLIDDKVKCVISRLGGQLRAAGTIEVAVMT